MPKSAKNKTNRQSTSKRRTSTKGLPGREQKLTGKDLKKIKGGLALQEATQMESRK
jgi:hypothetical protein